MSSSIEDSSSEDGLQIDILDMKGRTEVKSTSAQKELK